MGEMNVEKHSDTDPFGPFRTIHFAPGQGQPGRTTSGISWQVAILAMLLALLLSMAAQARPNPVTVRLSPEVEKAIKATDHKMAMRMKKAIQVGNRFIHLWFNNEVDYSPEEIDIWNKNVGPLVAMKGHEWEAWLDERWPITLVTDLPGGGLQRTSLMSCPLITLSGIKEENNDVSLTYRTLL
jgi:hypothetical protein